MPSPVDEDILRSLRRITRAIDLYGRKLASTYGLTGPQLVSLRTLAHMGTATPGKLAEEVALSLDTVTGILDRLVARQLVIRERDTQDPPLNRVLLTDAGRSMVESAPSPLQETFQTELEALPRGDQERIRDTLAQVVRMMGGSDIDAAPVLDADSDLGSDVRSELGRSSREGFPGTDP